jgi:sugar phosphate isomerase/epimerase
VAKPKIGLSMLYCLGEPFKKMLECIPKAETLFIEIVDDGYHTLNKQRVSMLKEVGRSYGLKYSVHAPFAGINIALHSKPLLNATMRRLKTSISNAGELGCDMWVFHPGMRTGISMFYPGSDWIRDLKSVRLLLKFARDCGLEAVIENVMDMFLLARVEEFRRFYDEINENISLVLDTGHANLYGEVQDFLTEFPNKIVHVHAHDNHGKIDQHLGIGYGNIDWEKTAGLLKKASYEKTIMIESVEHVEESKRKLGQLLSSF